MLPAIQPDPCPAPARAKSAKIRPADHTRAGEMARKFQTNKQEIITAWRLAFEGNGEPQQRAILRRARRLFPTAFPRRGRGNRKPEAAAAS